MSQKNEDEVDLGIRSNLQITLIAIGIVVVCLAFIALMLYGSYEFLNSSFQ